MRGREDKTKEVLRAGNRIFLAFLYNTHRMHQYGCLFHCRPLPLSPATIILAALLHNVMPQASDSSYAAVTRHRRPYSTAGRPPVFRRDPHHRLLSNDDDDVLLQHHEESVTTEEEDPDAGCVAPAGNSSAAAQSLRERRRREEGWNDHGLEALLASATAGAGALGVGESNSNAAQQQRRTAPHNDTAASG